MAKLDLEWLAVFDELYKTNSVSRAAERLGLAQATASIALNKLRLHFGDKLFTRTSKGMMPTPRADALYPELRDIIERLEAARGFRAEFVPAQSNREFHISITDISEIVLLPILLNRLQKVAPGIRLEIEKTADDSAIRLASGEVDLAVGFMPHLEAGFHQQILFTQNFVCLAARSHPRIANKLSRAAFLNEGHIVVRTSGTGHWIVDKVFEQQGMQRKVVLRLPSFLGVAHIVAETELLVTVPRKLGEKLVSQEEIKLLAPPVPLPSFSVKQHWHERFHADAGNIWLRRTIAELFATHHGRQPVQDPA
ncbi:LysR family transcriptional regulator [Oxalobacteraceae bacterium CAVE-383]|nr:LysR family transcriptional regulator [Oxalobacteraceae bacterium CAVE-383]